MSNEFKTTRERYKLNAEGDFYVEDGVCTACDAAPSEAPELIVYDEETYNCYFKRQPKTLEEVEKAIKAVCVSCVEALRYSGNDTKILDRLPIQCCDYYENNYQNLSQEIIFQYARGRRDFRLTEITKVDLNFEGMALRDVDFSRSFITANFRKTNLENSCFDHANLKTSDFSLASLENASFKFAALDGTRFKGANMKNANFEGASIQGYSLKKDETPDW